MSSREQIERILDQAYAARQRQDLEAVMECFQPDSCFTVNGSDTPATDAQQCRAAIGGLFQAFQLLEMHPHCRVIDPPRAAVHWRGKFRANNSGEVADTDILDLIEIRDGRIATFTTFFDTALAARMTGEGGSPAKG